MPKLISISSISKAEVLRRLYNGGFNDINHGTMAGFMQRMLPPMTLEEAQEYVDQNPSLYFDYVHGKCLKVDLSKDTLDPWGYDRDCGQGAASRALGIEATETKENE